MSPVTNVTRVRRTRTLCSALALAAVMATSACGGTSGEGADVSPSRTADPAVAKLVPARFKSEAIVNPIYNDAPPQNFLKEGKLVGVQPDLSAALAEVMGVKIETPDIGNFDTLIPGLQNGRYDMSSSDFGVTLEREKVIDFVYIFDLGTSFAVKKGSDLSIKDGADLCGHSVGLLSGSYFLPQADALNDDCTNAGKAALKIQKFPTQSAAILAVKNDRVEAYGASSDQIGYLASQESAGLDAQPFVYSPIPQGIGMPKDSDLTPAIAAALKVLIENGSYQKILDKWGLGSAAITSDQVATTPVPGAS